MHQIVQKFRISVCPDPRVNLCSACDLYSNCYCHSHASEHFSPVPSTTNVRPMNSVYFPAHVVLIIKRLVNVVSTLSISNQYFLHQQTPAKTDELPSANNLNGTGSMRPSDCLKDVEWPWWAVRRNWDMGLSRLDTRREIHDSGMLLKCKSTRIFKNIVHVVYFSSLLATIRLPNWFPNSDNWSWPHLFSFFQLEVNDPQPDADPPPPPRPPPERPPREDHDKEHQKTPPKDRVDLPCQDAKVTPSDIIHQLLVNPALYDPLLTPRYPIVLCHGLFCFKGYS